jgi:hypothetical protein
MVVSRSGEKRRKVSSLMNFSKARSPLYLSKSCQYDTMGTILTAYLAPYPKQLFTCLGGAIQQLHTRAFLCPSPAMSQH